MPAAQSLTSTGKRPQREAHLSKSPSLQAAFARQPRLWLYRRAVGLDHARRAADDPGKADAGTKIPVPLHQRTVREGRVRERLVTCISANPELRIPLRQRGREFGT